MPKTLGESQFAPISGATADITLVAAQPAGVAIRVLGFTIIAAAAAVATFQSGTGGAALTGAMTLATGIQVDADLGPWGHFETAAATLLNLHQTGTIQISGWLVWCTAS